MIVGIVFVVIMVYLKWFKPQIISKIRTTLLTIFLGIIYVAFSQKNNREVKLIIPAIIIAIGVGIDFFILIKSKKEY